MNHKEKIKQKIPKRINEQYLHNSGLYYLQRYAASSEHFKTVMTRKIKKSCAYHTDQNFEDCLAFLPPLIEKFECSGLLNDDVYIRAKVQSFRRKGLSKMSITQKLLEKGINQEISQRYIHDYDSENGTKNPELMAALTLCRKRKIGPYATTKKDDNELRKDLAKLARAGFSYEIAQKALNISSEMLEEFL